MNLSLGKLNYWWGRLMVMGGRFLTMANFVMLLYLTSQEQWFVILLVPIGIVLSLAYVWFDRKRVVEQELDTWFSLNPRLVGMEKDIQYIKERLK